MRIIYTDAVTPLCDYRTFFKEKVLVTSRYFAVDIDLELAESIALHSYHRKVTKKLFWQILVEFTY